MAGVMWSHTHSFGDAGALDAGGCSAVRVGMLGLWIGRHGNPPPGGIRGAPR